MPDLTVPRTTGGSLKGYQAFPPGGGPWPGVVVLHEAFGLNDDTRQQTDRLAAAGYLALAPDLFTDGGALRCLRATFAAHQSGHGQAFDDIEAARTHLAARADCTGRVGVIGFCLGGGFALMAAARGFDVAAPNYGVLPKDLPAALQGACPVVASYGGRDLGLRGAASRLEAALTTAGVEHDVKEYPGARHSFMNQHQGAPLAVLDVVARLRYDRAASLDAWTRILRFFGQHLR